MHIIDNFKLLQNTFTQSKIKSSICFPFLFDIFFYTVTFFIRVKMGRSIAFDEDRTQCLYKRYVKSKQHGCRS